MTAPIKQHLIDPEICIRCYTCEMTCPEQAIEHDDNNVVVDVTKCNHCMDCIAPCPTGSIDNWRVVAEPYSLEEQYEWMELPEEQPLPEGGDTNIEAMDEAVAALLAEAHAGAGGRVKAPASAAKPSVGIATQAKPALATVQGNYRLTAEDADADIRHLILSLGETYFPVLEGQSVGIVPPGARPDGGPHHPRLYSVSSPRDGERPQTNNLSLTVKREPDGLASNYVCDLKKGDQVPLIGPFGSTFLLPNDAQAHCVMICTGTGSAPFRGFTMRRQRTVPSAKGSLTLFFGARTPQALPYFGPLGKVPDSFLAKHFAFSRVDGQPKEYVQDKMRAQHEALAARLQDDKTHLYVCGLKAMEAGVEQALEDVARQHGLDWQAIRTQMREEGRYHVETY